MRFIFVRIPCWWQIVNFVNSDCASGVHESATLYVWRNAFASPVSMFALHLYAKCHKYGTRIRANNTLCSLKTSIRNFHNFLTLYITNNLFELYWPCKKNNNNSLLINRKNNFPYCYRNNWIRLLCNFMESPIRIISICVFFFHLFSKEKKTRKKQKIIPIGIDSEKLIAIREFECM